MRGVVKNRIGGSHVEAHIYSIHTLEEQIKAARAVADEYGRYGYEWFMEWLVERFTGPYFSYSKKERDVMFLPQVAAELAMMFAEERGVKND